MKLSEAMVLGDLLRERDGSLYLVVDESGKACGCAIGGAYLAIGKTEIDFREMSEFPWLMDSPDVRYWRDYISTEFVRVMAGEITFDQFIDYVRSVEPSCGECNRFDCSCVKSEAVPEAIEVLA